MAKKTKREIPKFDLPIIETHCHLDYLKEKELSEIIDLCKVYRIEKIITISVSPDNLQTVRDIASQYEFISCTQGIHPHEAKSWSKEVEYSILEGIKDKNVCAVGEIGLDFHYNKSPRDKQIKVFRRQLEIASNADLPVVIHSRDADQETIDVLQEMAPSLKKKGVIHSFTSGKELADTALDLGFYLGFNGIITFNNAENVREIVDLCPIDRLLLETDSPFLTPVPYRGRENAPYFLPFIAEKIAERKILDTLDVLKVTNKNAQDLFAI